MGTKEFCFWWLSTILIAAALGALLPNALAVMVAFIAGGVCSVLFAEYERRSV